MVFALLPNKKSETYERFFEIIKLDINNDPKSIMLDFEKATINAVGKFYRFRQLCFVIFIYAKIYGRIYKTRI